MTQAHSTARATPAASGEASAAGAVCTTKRSAASASPSTGCSLESSRNCGGPSRCQRNQCAGRASTARGSQGSRPVSQTISATA